MIITYTLKILELEVIPQLENLSNVVSKVFCKYIANSDDGKEAFQYYTIYLQSPSEESFIDYNLLSKEIIESWIPTGFIGEGGRITEQLNQKIQQQQNIIVYRTPPWEN